MRNRKAVKGLVVFAVILSWACVWHPFLPPVGISLQGAALGDGNGEKQEKQAPLASAPKTEESPKDDIDSEYLILVNKSHELDSSYKPDDLVSIKYYAEDRAPESRYMRAAAADAFHHLVEEAERLGIELVMTTAYRSYGFQSYLYDSYVAEVGKEAADRFSAEPGKSEHQTGLAVDVSSRSVSYQLTVEFADTEEGRWLSENAHLFGFVMRFPEGKEDITGYQYEPWHIRYVGLAAAGYMYENGTVLEEYLQLLEKGLEED